MEIEDGPVAEARAGSAEAFSTLIRLHQARVRSYLGQYVRDRDVVDDLAQETFLAAYRSLPTYSGEAPVAYWLIGIARHRALTYLRDRQRRRPADQEPLPSALAEWWSRRIESGPSLETDLKEMEALRGCLKKLPEKSATLVRDYYLQGRRAAEIAREEGRKERAVGMALFRIRQALRDCIRTTLTEASS